MMKQQASYKTRGMANGHISANKAKSTEEKTNQTVIFGAIGIGLLLIVLLYLTFGGSSFRGPSVVVGTEHISQLGEDKKEIPVHDKYVTVLGQKIFYRECNPIKEAYHRVDLLFLHGAKYSSVTWKGLGSLQIFASYGYRVIAVDLPGYGLSKTDVVEYTTDQQRVGFLESFIDETDMSHVVTVVPSMAGDYGIPMLIQSSLDNLDFELNGFVAIAPTGTAKPSKLDYQKVNIPVLIMWGERDRTEIQKQAIWDLENIPDSEQAMVPKAQHAAFVGNPQAFHTYILEFLQQRCPLTKDDYDDDYDFGGYDWYASDTSDNTNGYDWDGDLQSMFDDFSDDMTYDYSDENFMFDDQFDDDFGYSDDYSDTDTDMSSGYNTGSDDTIDLMTDEDETTDDTWLPNWKR